MWSKFNMIAFRGKKKVGPRPDWSPLGVKLKISDEHPRPFHIGFPPGREGTAYIEKRVMIRWDGRMWHWIFLPRTILVEQNCLPLNFLSLDFECKLRRILRKGDIDDITNELSQRALTKCDTNALLMAMEVGHEKIKYSFICCLF